MDETIESHHNKPDGSHMLDHHPAPLTLMTLNLRFGLADDGHNGWKHRKTVYAQLFELFPADFYLFQEANDFQIEFLSALLPAHDFIGQRQPAPDEWQNNVIFFRTTWQCTSNEHFYLSQTPEIPSKFKNSQWPRQCTMGTFRCESRNITIVNTHFDFENDVQCRSAELIIGKIDALKTNWPVIIAGDFNAGDDSDAYAIFAGQEDGFKDGFAPPRAGTFHGFRGKAEGAPIDWILYRGALRVKSAQVIDLQIEDRYPSDHFPLIVRFG